MKKHKIRNLIACGVLLTVMTSLVAGCGNNQDNAASATKEAEGKLKVVASVYPMYDFAQKIGGDKIDLTLMVPNGTEPHDWEPSPKDIRNLEEANMLVYNGAGMEPWLDDVLDNLKNEILLAEGSEGITLHKGHSHEDEDEAHDEKEEAHEKEDAHEEEGFDPHVWLAPENAKKEMENIMVALSKADPDNKAYYEDNYKKWADECDKLDQEFKDGLSEVAQKEIVVSHEAFGYLCDAYGLTQEGIEGINAESEPDPARMAEIEDFVKAHKVKVIFTEEIVSPKVANTIADATGAKVESLSPFEGLSDEQKKNKDDYFSIMRQNLEALKKALA